MKPILTLLLFILFQITNSWSQNLYLTASSGYNFSCGTSNFENYFHNNLVSAFYPYMSIDRVKYSLGKGMNFNVGLGYTTKHNIGFELEGSYLLGTKTIGRSEYIENDIFQKEIWGRFYRINPSVHVICPLKKISMKICIGGLLGFGKMYLNQEAIYQGVSWFKYENEFSGGYYAGFKAGVGLTYPLGERLNLSFDVNWINAWYSPTKARITKFMNGNYDDTNDISVWERETIYSNSVQKGPHNPNEPAHMLRENFAASSIGLQLGIQWILWKKPAKDEEQ